jgi:large subunit ribosomal protein L1
MAKRSKKYLAAAAQIKDQAYDLKDAIALVKQVSFEGFDASVEFAIRLNLDPRKAEQNLRGAVVLPHGTGKTKTVLVFAEGEQAKQAEEAGADYVGVDEYIEKIQKGWLDFDTVVSTPNLMGKIGRLGRVLGPRGLMPNPKTGTVTMDVEKAVSEIKAGKVNYRVDKVGNVHVTVGKVSFDDQKLMENIKVIFDTLYKLRPSTVKGVYVKNVAIASTMGPGVKVNVDSCKIKA